MQMYEVTALAPEGPEEVYQAMVFAEDEDDALNFTTLQFQRLDDMIESVGIGRDRLCTYCWDGRE